MSRRKGTPCACDCGDPCGNKVRKINGISPDLNGHFTIEPGTAINISEIVNGIRIDASVPQSMIFKGTVGSGGTIPSLPAADPDNTGYTYIAVSPDTSPVTYDTGDMLISNGSLWVVVPSGDEIIPIVTSWQVTPDDAHVPSEKLVKDSLPVEGVGITISGNIVKAKLKSESNATYDSNNITNTNGRQYAVVPDKTNGYLSANVPWTDEKVLQFGAHDNYEYPILMKYSATNSNITQWVLFPNDTNKKVTINPSTGTIKATAINAAIGSTTNNIGDDSHPVKVVNGILTPITNPITGSPPQSIVGYTVDSSLTWLTLNTAKRSGYLGEIRFSISGGAAVGTYSTTITNLPKAEGVATCYIIAPVSGDYKIIGKAMIYNMGSPGTGTLSIQIFTQPDNGDWDTTIWYIISA